MKLVYYAIKFYVQIYTNVQQRLNFISKQFNVIYAVLVCCKYGENDLQ